MKDLVLDIVILWLNYFLPLPTSPFPLPPRYTFSASVITGVVVAAGFSHDGVTLCAFEMSISMSLEKKSKASMR